jgi:hypothetical protein
MRNVGTLLLNPKLFPPPGAAFSRREIARVHIRSVYFKTIDRPGNSSHNWRDPLDALPLAQRQKAWSHISEAKGLGSHLNNHNQQLYSSGTAIDANCNSVSRPLRILVEIGWYHVMNRGIDARRLFPDDKAMAQPLVQRLVQPVTSQAGPAFSGAFQSRLARPS